MKTFFVLLGLLALACSFSHCNSDLSEESTSTYDSSKTRLSIQDVNSLDRNYGVKYAMLDVNSISILSQGELNLESIPVVKNGVKTGWIHCILKDDVLRRFLYEDFSELNNGNPEGYTYLYNEKQLIVKFKFEWSEYSDYLGSYKISYVNEYATIDSNDKVKSSYTDCVAATYKTAKDACDANPTCKLMCDAADVIGGQCTGSMLIAAAAHCLVNE